jgi:hypothetical protein
MVIVGIVGAMAMGIPGVNRCYGSDGDENTGSDTLLSFFSIVPIVPIVLMRFGFRMRRA